MDKSKPSDDEILQRLRNLHKELAGINNELSSAEKVDSETIEALGTLVSDVGSLVDQALEINDKDRLSERDDMLDRIMRFETNHPQVARFLSQITDVLAMMGI
jgi:hypothetical protein